MQRSWRIKIKDDRNKISKVVDSIERTIHVIMTIFIVGLAALAAWCF